MTPFRDIPIRRKLMLVIMLTTGVSLLLAGGASVTFELVRARRAVESDIYTQAQIIGANSAAALAFRDVKAASETLKSLDARPDIVHAWLYDAERRVFAQYAGHRHREPNAAPAWQTDGRRLEDGDLLMFTPVRLGADTVGTICLRADLREQRVRLIGYCVIAVGVLIISLIVAFLLSTRLQRMLSDPILALAQVARAVTERKNYSFRVVKHGQDEVGGLIDGFNQMLTEIQRREQALRSSEERFRQLAENVREVFWMTNLDKTQMIYISPAYEEVWGRTCASLYADPRDWVEAIHPEDRDRVLQAALAKQAKGEYDEQYRIVRRDGATRWIRDRAFPIRDDNGKPYRIAGLAEDITERKRAEEALREAKAQLQAIMDNSTAVIYLKDREERYILINRRFEALFHISREKIVGMTDYDLFPREMADTFHKNDRRVLEEKAPIHFEEIAPHEDGLHTYISVKFPFLDSAGEPYAVCGISTDITERKKAEQALETQARVLENMVEGVLVYDEQERILFTNSALDEMFGYARGELIGQQTFVLNPHSPQTCAEIAAEIRGHFKTHGSLEWQFLNRRQDGTKFISESRICRLQIDGQWCQVAVVQDVTERLRLEREILKISEREQARIGQDLHDGLCQQLVGAAFASNLLADKLRAHEPADAGDAEQISKMLDAAITEARNVARSLYPVKLEAEGLPAALEELVGSIARLFNVQCALDCPESITLADDNAAVHLYRIAQEAITNAVKHANPSRVEVALRPNCEHLVLTVRDDGDGLPQPTPAAVQGMGLHIMRYRARLIGGTIQIDSNADGGTTVTCSIPLPAKR